MKTTTKGARPKGRPYFTGTHLSEEEQNDFALLAESKNINKSALLRQLAIAAILKEKEAK